MRYWPALLLIFVFATAAGCGETSGPTVPSTPSPSPNPMNDRPLSAAGAQTGKLIGTAVQGNLLNNPSYRTVVEREFNALTAEYEMKWNIIEPGRGTRDFSRGDTIVNFGGANANARHHTHAVRTQH